ncbi:hypothetical protein PTKIN_Ptkin05aG0062200 [Pterospermum kingtungense]
MATNKERIENLEPTLRKLQDNLIRMELGVNDKLHRLEIAISKISEVLLAKQEYPTISHVHDQGNGQSLSGRAREYIKGHVEHVDEDKDKKSVAMLHMIAASSSSKELGNLNASDAKFYVKVGDDVYVNLGMLATTLGHHHSKPRVYVGCIKYGPLFSLKIVKYHEPEYWKFGEEGNTYFRHATRRMHAISKGLDAGKHLDHAYLNENVSLFEVGCMNLARHITIINAYGVNVVAVNKFSTNTGSKLNAVRNVELAFGAFDAIICTHHVQHRSGVVDVIVVVQKAYEIVTQLAKFLYSLDINIKEKIEAIARSYVANGVEFTEQVGNKSRFTTPKLCICYGQKPWQNLNFSVAKVFCHEIFHENSHS